jgi:thioredoxin-like negative regulator of GroEL
VKPFVIIFLILALLIGVGAGGTLIWRNYTVNKRADERWQTIQQLVQAGEDSQALQLILLGVPASLEESEILQWKQLELSLVTRLRHFGLLERIARDDPPRLYANEAASLLYARILLHQGRESDYRELLSRAVRSEKNKAGWILLEANRLYLSGELEAATELLQSVTFSGRVESERLLHLAILQQAMGGVRVEALIQTLENALSADPWFAEVRLFAANILETGGAFSAARRQYVAAHLLDPQNPLYRDALATYYLRRGNIRLAFETLIGDESQPVPGFIWMKAWFWQKVALGPFSGDLPRIENDDLFPLVAFLRNLPQGAYWDFEAARKLPQIQAWTQRYPELHYLRLLALLKKGDLEAAESQLQRASPAMRQFAPQLDAMIRHLVALRQQGYLRGPALPNLPIDRQPHAFLRLIMASEDQSVEALSETIAANELELLQSSTGFAAAFITRSWMQAALDFTDVASFATAPAWFQYGILQSLRFTQSDQTGWPAYMSATEPSPANQGVIAEMHLAMGNTAEALSRWKALSSGDDAASHRAAWLLSTARLELNQTNAAEAVLRSNPGFAETVLGKEIRARIALQRDERPLVESLYRDLGEQSLEGMAFLARLAFSKGEWEEARDWTRKLAQQRPNNPQLLENLNKIEAAIKAAEETTTVNN